MPSPVWGVWARRRVWRYRPVLTFTEIFTVQKLPIRMRKRALPDSSKLTVTPAAPSGVGTKMPVVVL